MVKFHNKNNFVKIAKSNLTFILRFIKFKNRVVRFFFPLRILADHNLIITNLCRHKLVALLFSSLCMKNPSLL